MRSIRPLVLSLFVLSLVVSLPVGATTYMMMPDSALADQARAVVDVRVVGVDSAPVVDGPPSTDYLVEVNRVLKGDLPGSTLVVRVPGGINPQGLGLRIWGAPQFAPGEDAILFVNPAKDGTYRILHLMLGAFHRRTLNGQPVALRDLSEAQEIGKDFDGNGQDAIRQFDRFSDWIADRAEGFRHEGSYVLGTAKAQLSSTTENFTFLIPGDGNPIRWFRFDLGQNVQWKVNNQGQPGLGLTATIQAFQTAMNVWNNDPNTNINYVYTGTTAATAGFDHSDGINAIVFGDPNNDVEGNFDCSSGGVIAQGGPFFTNATRSYKGQLYHEAVEADIETNDGTDCLFGDNPTGAQEVFGHELGHTLGLGHSALRDALMFANVHNDGRGARLTDDDRAGIAVLYGTGSGGGGGSAPAAPQKLTAQAISNTSVVLNWRDRATNEDTYRVEVKVGKNKYNEIKQLPANSITVQIDNLTPGTTYTFRVRAAGGGKFSPYAAVNVTLPH
ncbi:MAG TPA: matrixin family metalloprotease [Thermoanaerobaculia bacterium]|nr:matrixin family metalloprotease [Thermoanaerobaculia bacterium]